MDPQPAIPAGQPLEAPQPVLSDAAGGPRPEPAAPTQAELDAAMLQRVAEIIMDVAEAIGRRARADLAPVGVDGVDGAAGAPSAAGEPRVVPANDGAAAPLPKLFEGDLALAISRVSRAVRMTVFLRARLAGEAAQGGEGAGEGGPAPRTNIKVEFVHPADGRREARKAEVGRIVRRVAEAGLDDDLALDDDQASRDEAAGERDPTERVERLVREAAERLDEVETFGDLLARPLSESVAMICRDLGLAPDWTRLADEVWARAEVTGGAVGAPLAALAPQSQPPEPRRPPPEGAGSRPPDPPSPQPVLSDAAGGVEGPPEISEEERAAAARAERLAFAEYGPRGQGAWSG